MPEKLNDNGEKKPFESIYDRRKFLATAGATAAMMAAPRWATGETLSGLTPTRLSHAKFRRRRFNSYSCAN